MGKALSKTLLIYKYWLFIRKWNSSNQFPNEQDVLGLIPGEAFFLFPFPSLSFPFLSFPFFLSFFLEGGGVGLLLYLCFVCLYIVYFVLILYIFFSLLASFLLFAINPKATQGSVMYVFIVFFGLP